MMCEVIKMIQYVDGFWEVIDGKLSSEEFSRELGKKRDAFLKENFNIDNIDSLTDIEFNELYDKLYDIYMDELDKKTDPEEEISEYCSLVSDWVSYMARQYDDDGKRKQSDNNKQ